MPTEGERLGAVQFEGHLAIDDIYTPLSTDVETAVIDASASEDDPFPASAVLLALLAIGRLLDRDRPITQRAILHTVTLAIEVAQVGRPPLPPIEATRAALPAYAPVSQSLMSNRSLVLRQSEALLRRGVSMGQSVREIATAVRQYFSPWFASRRTATGAMTRAGRQGAIASWPGQAGMASARPRLAMLTESTAAHTRTEFQIALYGNNLMKYTLSPHHSKADECTGLAHASRGFGPGVYEPRNAPFVPRHPRCRCHYVQVERPR